MFDPLVVSWGYEAAAPSHSQFLDYHQMQGTRDFSAFLTVPRALKFMQEHNWEVVAADCRKLARENYLRFCELLGSVPHCPVNDDFLGQMCSIPIRTTAPEGLQLLLFEKYRIEVPVMRQDEHVYIRYSVQGYNTQDDLDRLYRALEEIRGVGDLIQ